MLDDGSGPVTSSLGRLFDGVASIVLGILDSEYEGEPAMRLESMCGDKHQFTTKLAAVIANTMNQLRRSATPQVLHWRPLVRQIFNSMQAGCSAVEMARLFHATIGLMVVNVVDQFPQWPVVLSGGCVQNRLLTETIVVELEQRSRQICVPGRIPPNDGGLAAGQLAIVVARLQTEHAGGDSAVNKMDDAVDSRRFPSCA